MRITQEINTNWLFQQEDDPAAQNTDYDDSAWQHLTIPHDWAINSKVDPPVDFAESDLINPSGYRWQAWQGFFDRYGIAWYRRYIKFPQAERHFLEFDGVFQECDVYLNGNLLGHHHYGYTSFGYEVSDFVDEHRNVLAVRVDNSREHLCDRWYSGCGIIRPVQLISTHSTRIKRHGIVISNKQITDKSAQFNIEVALDGEIAAGYQLQVAVSHKLLGKIAQQIEKTSEMNVFMFELNSPLLWSTDSPNLYHIEILLLENGAVIDNESLKYGFREIKVSARDGFVINGKRIKLKGVNIHHDLGAIGAAWNRSVMKWRLQILKNIGCNAIRTSHNPPAAELLSLCDEMGFLVMDEACDKWDTLRYGLIFEKCWQEDLIEMIERDRNHPCIFCWSVGNEVNNQASDKMIALLAMLSNKARELDDSRFITYCMEPHVFVEEQRQMTSLQKAELAGRIAEHVDILSGNYHEQYYPEYHKLMPDMVYIASEAYPFFQNSPYQTPAYIDKNPWRDVCENDFVLGEFVWPGIDYLGEANWPARMWSGGIIDSTGRIKEIGYLIKSFWMDIPVVHVSIYDESLPDMRENSIWGTPPLAGHWNFAHKSRPFVRGYIFTNCERVLVKINAQPVKEIATNIDEKSCFDIYLPNIPGELKVEGINNGQAVCSYTLRTADEPHHIELTIANQDDPSADIFMIEARIVDRDGIVCPHYNKSITFLSSDAQFIASDNGDPTDHTPYASNTRRAVSGRCMGYFRADQNGLCKITVISENLAASIDLREPGEQI